jgi:hypothetical protein
MGALEEVAKATSQAVSSMGQTPLVLALVIMNLGLLVFHWYYTARVQDRIENTAKQFFMNSQEQGKQWTTVLAEQNKLTEKTIHCILPEDALKLLQGAQRAPVAAPEKPQ